MRRLGLFILFLFTVAPSDRAGAEPDDRFHMPAGFVIEKVAGEPEVRFPMFAVFDDRGRLYVAESSGLNLYEELRSQTRRCRVRRLEDRDGDGRFESSRVFADKLVFPMGLCWRDGRLYVADPPDLVAYHDRDGDGRADDRDVILSGFGHRDNGSLHGLIFGPDGLLYMTMGTPDGYRLEQSDGTVLSGKSGALIRCRMDGSDPEVICRGFDNLVEVVFTGEGDVFGTDNWFQWPVGGIRDALVDLSPGGLYPRQLSDDGTPHPVTGPPLPAISLFPAVALSGLTRYEGGALGDAFGGHLFSAQHNARSIGRHEIVRVDGTVVSRDSVFVTSDDPDFHPSDVLQDGQGALLVVDTGGWYVHHCPTGRIRDSRAPGGIYRVRKSDARRWDDPWGGELNWQRLTVRQLCRLLSDPRPRVRNRASRQLTAVGPDAVGALATVAKDADSIGARQQALWALARMDHPASLPPIRDALDAPRADVVLAAARGLAFRKDKTSRRRLSELLSAPHPHVQRAAAEALARCGDRETLAPLLVALTHRPTRFVEHALIFAISRLASKDDLLVALEHLEPNVQRSALLLLDQHPHRAEIRTAVVDRLSAADPALRRTALRILADHPEWAPEAHTLLQRWIEAPALADEQRAALQNLILAFQDQSALQQLVGSSLTGGTLSTERRLLLITAIQQCSLDKLPDTWIEGLALRQSQPEVRQAAVRTVATLQLPALDEELAQLSARPDIAAALRIEALRGIVARRAQLSDTAFELLIEQLDDASNPLPRLATAEVLGRARLSQTQFEVLLETAPADPLIWPSLLAAFGKSDIQSVGLALVRRISRDVQQGGWRPSAADLTDVLGGYPAPVMDAGEPLLQQLRERQGEILARLADYQPLLSGGDARRGQQVFFGRQVACSACHRIGDQGATWGRI